MSYAALKILHMSLALISISGFVLRWVWLNSNSRMFRHKLTRVLPHVIDTLFLATGIWLAIVISQYPLSHGWLTAKVLGLIAYVIVGSIAMKDKNEPLIRTIAFIGALVIFAWIVSVARTKSAWGFLGLLI